MEQYIKASKTVGNNIRAARKSKKLTQEALVASMQTYGCDISRSGLAKVESGIRHISVEELKAIKKILAVDYSQLIDGLIL